MSFLIVGGHRVGTHMLHSMLMKHPSFCYPRWIEHFTEIRELGDIKEVSDNHGMIIHYYQFLRILKDNVESFIRKQQFLSWMYSKKIIHLTRENERARAISNIYMRYSAGLKYHYGVEEDTIERRPDGRPLLHSLKDATVPDYSQLEFDESIKNHRDRQKETESKLNLDNSLHITYEWLCGGKNLEKLDKEKSKVICDFLEIETIELTSHYTKNIYANSNC